MDLLWMKWGKSKKYEGHFLRFSRKFYIFQSKSIYCEYYFRVKQINIYTVGKRILSAIQRCIVIIILFHTWRVIAKNINLTFCLIQGNLYFWGNVPSRIGIFPGKKTKFYILFKRQFNTLSNGVFCKFFWWKLRGLQPEIGK